jgi:RND family efflux transporter MFP subunit
MRVVVQVPDRDVPYTQIGDKALIAFDALPSEKFEAKVSRLAEAENPETRTMRVEVDVTNATEIIRDGMYGQVEIELEPAAPGITIPSACLFGAAKAGEAKVFIAADGKVRLTSIVIGKDTGAVVEVTSGITAHDRVVVKPPAALTDGMPVEAVAQQLPKPGAH